MANKIVEIDDLAASIAREREAGQRIVLCQGHFNVVHPGHVRFLQYAKNLGERLVVIVLGTGHLPDDFRSHYFNEEDRLANVEALHFVDYVYLLQGTSTPEGVIELLRPDYYVLGQEFEQELAGSVEEQLQVLKEAGGQVVFHSGGAEYGDRAPQSVREVLDRERLLQFLQTCAKQDVEIGKLKKKLADFSKCRLLVIGDMIVDSYVSCQALGMSSEAPLVVAKELESLNYLGGAGIVAAHVSALGASCEYLTVVGEDREAEFAADKLAAHGVKAHLIADRSRPTTFKTRFLIENQKVFRLSRLNDHPLLPVIEGQLIDRLIELAPHFDGVIVSDFNYGVMTKHVIETLAELAERHSFKLIGDLQCSSQIGDIRRLQGYDLLCPNEKEARISLHSRDAGLEWIAKEMFKTAATRNLILKLGASGLIAYTSYPSTANDDLHRSQHFPALVSNPLDVMGAGDALLATTAISLCCGLDIMESAALGVCSAALAVQNMGNVPITTEALSAFLDNMN
jgi:rfaE bifunctional protein kinase chain/domain